MDGWAAFGEFSSTHFLVSLLAFLPGRFFGPLVVFFDFRTRVGVLCLCLFG